MPSWPQFRGNVRRVEPQVLPNPGVHQPKGQIGAHEAQAPREAAGGVSNLRVGCPGRFHHDVGNHAGLVFNDWPLMAGRRPPSTPWTG